MPRFILIDNNSGYIFGDTAALPQVKLQGEDFAMSQSELSTDASGAERAARWVDEAEAGAYGRVYAFSHTDPRTSATGYHVWRADVGGSDAVTAVSDGQDREMIEAVERDCEYVGFVFCRDAEAEEA